MGETQNQNVRTNLALTDVNFNVGITKFNEGAEACNWKMKEGMLKIIIRLLASQAGYAFKTLVKRASASSITNTFTSSERVKGGWLSLTNLQELEKCSRSMRQLRCRLYWAQ